MSRLLSRGYVICGSPRSGSSYLCELLGSTQVLGYPREYFNIDAGRGFAGANYPEDPRAQFEELKRLAATPNGIYGLKIFPRQFESTIATGWIGELPALSFVFMRRRDLLGQAISLVRAAQTGQWNSFNRPSGQAVYDAALIDERLASIARQEARWGYYFARNGAAPLNLFYEDVVADPQTAVAAVGQLMSLPESPKLAAELSPTKIQRDPLTDEWRAMFIAERRNLIVFH